MEPIRTTRYLIRFAAAWSAWWLIPAVALIALVGIWLYRRQGRSVLPGHVAGLAVLRVLVLAAAAVLAFRPSLVRRDIALFPGRLLLLLDNAASMGVHDPQLADGEALHIARALSLLPDTDAPVAVLRDAIAGARERLIRFDQFSRRADRGSDRFWREAGQVESQVLEALESVVEQSADLAQGYPPAAGLLQEAAARSRTLPALLLPLFSGEQVPDQGMVERMRTGFSELIALLEQAQQGVDTTRLHDGDPAYAKAAATVRGTPRLELVHQWIQDRRSTLAEQADGLSLWVHPLSGATPLPLDASAGLPSYDSGDTDLAGALLGLIEEEHPFPLAGILLFSDGRDLGGTPLENVTRAAARRSVPVFSAGVGGLEEPPDIALRAVEHAPFSVQGEPFGLHVALKTVLPSVAASALVLLHADGATAVRDALTMGEAPGMRHRLVFAPEEAGIQRLAVLAEPVAGEVVPVLNNRLEVAVHIREEKIQVLFVDWKPRWQSRFMLNILNRLGYLEVNAIIGLVQPDGQVVRGVGRGLWPEEAAALAHYDLVILGDLPENTLSPDEWRMLEAYVRAGGSLAWLGTGQRDPLAPALAASLLPTVPRTQDTAAVDVADALRLTVDGLHHPVTRHLQGHVRVTDAAGATPLADTALALLQGEDGRVLVSSRYVDAGKTLLFDTDRLWRRLNTVALEAHAGMVAGLIDWAVETRSPQDGLPVPERLRVADRDKIVVRLLDAPAHTVVEMRSGEALVSVAAQPVAAASRISVARFEPPGAGDWAVAVAGGEAAAEAIHVLERGRELHDLSQDAGWLEAVSQGSGGRMAALAGAGRLLADVLPRSREERRERIWRLWDSPWVLGLLIGMLTVEWIWRKLAGLV